MVQVLPQGPHPLQPVKGLTVQVVNQSHAIQVTVDWDRSSITRMGTEIRRVIRHTPGMRLDLSLPQVTSVVNPGPVSRGLGNWSFACNVLVGGGVGSMAFAVA